MSKPRKVRIHDLDRFYDCLGKSDADISILQNDTRKIVNALFRRRSLFPSEYRCLIRGLYYFSLYRPDNTMVNLYEIKYFNLYLSLTSGLCPYETIFSHLFAFKPHPLLKDIDNALASELFLYLCHKAHTVFTPADAYRFLLPICKAAQLLWTRL